MRKFTQQFVGGLFGALLPAYNRAGELRRFFRFMFAAAVGNLSDLLFMSTGSGLMTAKMRR